MSETMLANDSNCLPGVRRGLTPVKALMLRPIWNKQRCIFVLGQYVFTALRIPPDHHKLLLEVPQYAA